MKLHAGMMQPAEWAVSPAGGCQLSDLCRGSAKAVAGEVRHLTRTELYFVLVALAALVGCSLRSAQPTEHRFSMCGEGDVRLTIRSAKDSYTIGEPIEVFLTIENISSRPLDLRAVNPSTGEIVGFDYDPIENPRCFFFLKGTPAKVELDEVDWGEANRLGVGGIVEKRVRLVPLGDESIDALRKPGRYVLTGHFCWGWSAELGRETPPITIEIRSE
jgi:hypothetical protein